MVGLPGSAPLSLPHSRRAEAVALSPADATAYYLAPGPRTGGGGLLGALRVWRSSSPYRRAASPPGLEGLSVGRLLWSGDGRTLFLSTNRGGAVFTPATGRVRWVKQFPQSVSHDGRVAVYTTERELRVWWPSTGRTRVLFTVGRPWPLIEALMRAAKRPGPAALMQALDPALYREPSNWAFGAPALSPNGRTVYFAANAGTGQGASGNTLFCLFSADVATGALKVLSGPGAYNSRIPELCQVSPDGRKLLFITAAHSSAVENPRKVVIADLPGQRAIEVLGLEPAARGRANLTDGACWSPDSRTIAISTAFYDAEGLITKGFQAPRDADYTLYLKDAATGRTVARVRGARRPSWSR